MRSFTTLTTTPSSTPSRQSASPTHGRRQNCELFPSFFLSLDPGSLHYSALLRSLRSLDLHRLFGHLWASYMLIHVSSLEFQQKCKLRGVLILAEVLTFWSFIKVVSFLESHRSCSAFLALGQNCDLVGLSAKLWAFMSSGSFTSDKRQSASTCLAVSGEKDKNHIKERWWYSMVKTEQKRKCVETKCNQRRPRPQAEAKSWSANLLLPILP